MKLHFAFEGGGEKSSHSSARIGETTNSLIHIYTMNIKELLLESGNVTLAVTPTDLQEFAVFLIDEAKSLALQEKQPEQYLTPDETAKRFNVSLNTLWRWSKSGYLVPIKTGRTPRYKLSDIEKLLSGRQ